MFRISNVNFTAPGKINALENLYTVHPTVKMIYIKFGDNFILEEQNAYTLEIPYNEIPCNETSL